MQYSRTNTKMYYSTLLVLLFASGSLQDCPYVPPYTISPYPCSGVPPPNQRSYPKNCAEAFSATGVDGVFWLNTPSYQPFTAYCLGDRHNGAAWTLIQRRQDGSVNFDRGWYDYKNGFGTFLGEFWLGLDKVHAITHGEPTELMILMQDSAGKTRYAKYSRFEIGSEAEKYIVKQLGSYSGNAGNYMHEMHWKKFTTRDNDNDRRRYENCAALYQGGWWYGFCRKSTINGPYSHGRLQAGRRGVVWAPYSTFSIKYVHMAIRPIYYALQN